MKHSLKVLVICLMLIQTFVYATEDEKVLTAAKVLQEIMDIPEQSIPPKLLENAYAVAIIPEVVKVGFIVGGRFGRGIVSVKTKSGKWSNPSFITLTGGSLGWQIGAQSTDIILVFKTRRSIDGLIGGKFTLGADAAVAAGPVGRMAEAATDVMLKAEIYSYSRSRGLFAGISLEGSALQIDYESNARYYKRSDIFAADIFSKENLNAPLSAKKLKQVLNKYSR